MTIDFEEQWKEQQAFQLTSSRRGWQKVLNYIGAEWYFNSHPHEEDDLTRVTDTAKDWYFNSHPHEEDDRDRGRSGTGDCHFNSHPHEEDDENKDSQWCMEGHFNSHPHEEDDVLVFYKPAILVYFNSHPHEEDDESYRENPVFRVISTHILTKRMTRWKWLLDTWPYISTHILTKRMTRHFPLFLLLYHHFNSHPHEEDDLVVVAL